MHDRQRFWLMCTLVCCSCFCCQRRQPRLIFDFDLHDAHSWLKSILFSPKLIKKCYVMSLNVTVENNNVKWYGFQFRKKITLHSCHQYIVCGLLIMSQWLSRVKAPQWQLCLLQGSEIPLNYCGRDKTETILLYIVEFHCIGAVDNSFVIVYDHIS